MIHGAARRSKDAGLETAMGNHSFRAIGISDDLENGGDINIAKRMAATPTSTPPSSTIAAGMRSVSARLKNGDLTPVRYA